MGWLISFLYYLPLKLTFFILTREQVFTIFIIQCLIVFLAYCINLYWLLLKNENVKKALFFIVAYEFTTSFIMAEWHDVIQSTRVILHPLDVRWDFLAPVKMSENPVWYARMLYLTATKTKWHTFYHKITNWLSFQISRELDNWCFIISYHGCYTTF